MKVYTTKEIKKILKSNGYSFLRYAKGDHEIWSNQSGNKLCIKSTDMNRMVWQRLVKENNLNCKF
jgi:predicted RNA binding protein YcfA (HicA-like mRNA interferase family)